MQKRIIWVAIALLILAALACSLGRRATPTPEVVQPSPTPEGGVEPTAEAATEEAPPPEISSDALQNLNSYRSRLVWHQIVEGEATETLTVEQEETREPAAKRIVITTEGGEKPGTMELVQIGNTSWLCSEGQCIQTQQSAEEASSQFGEGMIKPEEVVSSSDYEYVGRDTINGVRARHYVLKLDPLTLAGLAQGKITTVQADVWVADEPGMPAYMTRFSVSWEGVREEDNKKIRGDWVYEIYDVNKPITIKPPEEATGVPEDIPICEGATDQAIMGDLIMYSCAAEPADVAEFYRNEMPNKGWTAGEESTLGNMITQEWKKEGRTASLMIAPRDEGGTSVMISIQK